MSRRPLTFGWSTPDPGTGLFRLDGDLDFDSGDALLAAVTDQLAASAGLRDLRLDCAKVRFCDSWGLSVLLMIHRRVQAAGACLHLDNRQASLERLLDRTNTLVHLTGSGAELSEHQQDT
jgi:anti-anti-sigma factor